MSAKTRWYFPTVSKWLAAVLLLQGVLFLSAYAQWFWFNKLKGYTVLITIAATAASLLLLVAWVLGSRLTKYKAQFSLAALLTMALVMALPCGWLAREINLARRQRTIVESLRGRSYAAYHPRMGTSPLPALFDWEQLGLGKEFFADPWHVVCDPATEADMTALASLHLTSLEVGGEAVTDQGVARLRDSQQLRSVGLRETKVTDASLDYLSELKELRGLDFSHTRITDAGLVHLKKLAHLSSLNLVGTQITDAGLEHLRGHAHLGRLELPGGQLTDGAVEELRRALPDCTIYRR